MYIYALTCIFMHTPSPLGVKILATDDPHLQLLKNFGFFKWEEMGMEGDGIGRFPEKYLDLVGFERIFWSRNRYNVV